MNKIALVFLLCLVSCPGDVFGIKAPDSPEKAWVPRRWAKEDKEWEQIRARSAGLEKDLVLEDLFDIALKNSPSLRYKLEKARSAEAEADQAHGAWLPKITSSGKFARQRKTAHPVTDSLNQKRYGFSIDGKYDLFDFGARMSRSRAGENSLLAANYGFNREMQNVLVEVEKAYYGLDKSDADVRAKEANLEDAEKALEVSRTKFASGIVARLDVLKAESEYYKALYNLEDSKASLKKAKGDLAVSMGLPADTDIKVRLVPEGYLPEKPAEQEVMMLIEEAILKRADIAALRAGVDAARDTARARWGDLWPVLSLGGSTGRNWSDTFGDNKRYARDYEYTGYLSFDWNIFDGAENINKKKQADAEARSAREELIKGEIAASADVWSKFYDMLAADKKMEYAETFHRKTLLSFELTLEGYDSGINDIVDLLNAQSDLADARSLRIQAREELFVSFAELTYATGSLYYFKAEEGEDQ